MLSLPDRRYCESPVAHACDRSSAWAVMSHGVLKVACETAAREIRKGIMAGQPCLRCRRPKYKCWDLEQLA